MRKPYVVLVVFTAITHFAYLIYVPSGGFLALRWPRTVWLHVPTVLWGIGVVALPLPCPLTALEQWARAHAEMNPLPTTGFIDRYVAGIFYPAHRTRLAQACAFIAAGISWIALAKQLRRKAIRRAYQS
ncbi:hypothetical protein B1987_20735 [Mycobacterium kansasii]|uniref:DUF2784 domain-containing protein n=1 Tax=Mycobacterium attenuatum TaxID=2341086 RepID=A0A498PSC0_9MYCO|nr:DUF2784 domain-containing protein [Mycobacterium attenuatum]ORB85805.1 hypothetical protein B1987_20735 [Mycobacterium kansasii]VBA35617.1 hypothetical protein LAUMK136_01100 [Mycobacterium attenuatum]VBA48198.1 hypothetical protein LAUMK191_01099 [Mycobacterium attenuatum]VBA52506.1 hypothetical protein LAUMK41_01189 [Mycobacterium attenuatum]